MQEAVKEKLQQIRMRKLECQRHIKVLFQKLASNPRDLWTRRELERMEELLAKLEEHEKRLLGENNRQAEDEKDDEAKSENSGGG
ncbi:MAG: hypothetical protein ACUVTP_04540 [Candidatus Fervidibacter sp.]|uniref:hypothetical protein n=1 Tax=Candidatus Fervidibacter sp. TaxID=3100871 RepID=UPI00404B45F0